MLRRRVPTTVSDLPAKPKSRSESTSERDKSPYAAVNRFDQKGIRRSHALVAAALAAVLGWSLRSSTSPSDYASPAAAVSPADNPDPLQQCQSDLEKFKYLHGYESFFLEGYFSDPEKIAVKNGLITAFHLERSFPYISAYNLELIQPCKNAPSLITSDFKILCKIYTGANTQNYFTLNLKDLSVTPGLTVTPK